MKRTLLEITGALAVAVILVSFHHQITRLRETQADVVQLRSAVQAVKAKADERQELSQAERDALQAIGDKVELLETRVRATGRSERTTEELRQEIRNARMEVVRFQSEIGRDVSRTRELVDAFHREARQSNEMAREELDKARDTLRSLSDRIAPDPSRLDDQLLAPTVQLNGDDTVGSGTLIYSRFTESTGRVESYVLTSYHVVRNILADTPSARRTGIALTIYNEGVTTEERADMVAHRTDIDAALLRLRGEREMRHTARVASRDRAKTVRTWERIYAVGCPLGNDPIPTQGEVSSTQNELSGTNYWMINAPTYFGNSGGGIYLSESRELIGVFSKIYTHGRGNPVVVPHMGLCTPMDTIYEWLQDEGLAYVLKPEQPVIDPADLAAPPGN